jgi:glycosyltransferase involved in cell wall biosynthesis
VKYLSKNHDITFLSIKDWWKAEQGDLKSYSCDFEEIFKRVNILHLTDRKVSPILQELLSGKRVNEIAKEGFDVHLNYSTLSSGYTAARRINTVYDIADDLVAMIRSSPQIPVPLRPFGGALGSFFLKKNIDISKIVTVTTDLLIDSCKVPRDKSMVVPNGVDMELFRDYGSIKRDELDLDGFVIGYVGVLREWVDLGPVFKALKDLNKDIKMLVVGKEGRFKENVDLARNCGVADRIRFAGMVPYAKVPEYISAMDVCLIPFKKNDISENALPLKLFEYTACSRPVISTKLLGIEKAVGDLVKYADNSDDYKIQIMKLYNDEKLRQEMCRSGRRMVESTYDWSKVVERMEDTLEACSGMA